VSSRSDRRIVESLGEKSRRLEALLDDYGGRLRRMRQRNRELEQEIGEFEQELERLKEWLGDLPR
jgi:predicted RNase H-like nuclease (RuvC/YqgF family)